MLINKHLTGSDLPWSGVYLLLQVGLSVFVGKCKIRSGISLEAQALFEIRQDFTVTYNAFMSQAQPCTPRSAYVSLIYDFADQILRFVRDKCS